MDEFDSLDAVDIDWENPFDEIRSSEVLEIDLLFLNNGIKVVKEDEKGDEYTQFRFKCVREDISKPSEVTYITSSKRLIEEIAMVAPIKDKHLTVVKSGTGFQTKYRVTERTE